MAICVDIVPTPCGGTNKLTMKDACNDVHFTGIEDTTINQGVGIDLTEGIHAYDGNGNEIEYTVTPDSIDKCDVGEHTVVYRTIGEGDKFLPSFCMDNVDVTLGDTFCNEILLEEDRIVTITQADPPTIEGIETIPTIYPNEEFDPTEGITATDDNGKTIDFTYSGRVEDSSEGAIASFETEFEQNALSVIADIEPIQDLHGYNKPWVGGAGKNLLGFRAINSTLNGVTFVSTGEKISITGTATAIASPYEASESTVWATARYGPYPAGQYTVEAKGFTSSVATDRIVFNGVYEDGSKIEQFPNGIRINAGAVTFTASAPFKCGLWLYIASGSTINAPSVEVILNKGSAIESWTPYSNICPISGRTEVVTHRTGKNLLKNKGTSKTVHGVTFTFNTDGTVTVNGTADALYDKPVNPRFLLPVGTYIFSGGAIGTGDTNMYIFLQKKNGSTKYVTLRNDTPATFDVTDDVAYLGCSIRVNANQTYQNAIFKPMVRLASDTDITYEPYQGTTYTTALGRTVYGGTLDVVSGVLVVDKYYYEPLSSTSWATYDNSTLIGRSFSSIGIPLPYVKNEGQNVADITSSHFVKMTQNNATTVGNGIAISKWKGNDFLYFSASEFGGNLDTFKSYLDTQRANGTPVQVVYELATPQTYQLTPQQIQTLVGQNNVWADTGDIKVIYEKEMPASGNIEYLTAGLKIITYTATDECGNQTVEQRIVYVLGDTPQVCMAEVCTAHVACEDNQ